METEQNIVIERNVELDGDYKEDNNDLEKDVVMTKKA